MTAAAGPLHQTTRIDLSGQPWESTVRPFLSGTSIACRCPEHVKVHISAEATSIASKNADADHDDDDASATSSPVQPVECSFGVEALFASTDDAQTQQKRPFAAVFIKAAQQMQNIMFDADTVSADEQTRFEASKTFLSGLADLLRDNKNGNRKVLESSYSNCIVTVLDVSGSTTLDFSAVAPPEILRSLLLASPPSSSSASSSSADTRKIKMSFNSRTLAQDIELGVPLPYPFCRRCAADGLLDKFLPSNSNANNEKWFNKSLDELRVAQEGRQKEFSCGDGNGQDEVAEAQRQGTKRQQQQQQKVEMNKMSACLLCPNEYFCDLHARAHASSSLHHELQQQEVMATPSSTTNNDGNKNKEVKITKRQQHIPLSIEPMVHTNFSNPTQRPDLHRLVSETFGSRLLAAVAERFERFTSRPYIVPCSLRAGGPTEIFTFAQIWSCAWALARRMVEVARQRVAKPAAITVIKKKQIGDDKQEQQQQQLQEGDKPEEQQASVVEEAAKNCNDEVFTTKIAVCILPDGPLRVVAEYASVFACMALMPLHLHANSSSCTDALEQLTTGCSSGALPEPFVVVCEKQEKLSFSSCSLSSAVLEIDPGKFFEDEEAIRRQKMLELQSSCSVSSAGFLYPSVEAAFDLASSFYNQLYPVPDIVECVIDPDEKEQQQQQQQQQDDTKKEAVVDGGQHHHAHIQWVIDAENDDADDHVEQQSEKETHQKQQQHQQQPKSDIDAQHLVGLFPTSGSTSTSLNSLPKLAQYSRATWLRRLVDAQPPDGKNGLFISVQYAPMYHFSARSAVWDGLFHGGTRCLVSDVCDLLELIPVLHPTGVFLVPALWPRMKAQWDFLSKIPTTTTTTTKDTRNNNNPQQQQLLSDSDIALDLFGKRCIIVGSGSAALPGNLERWLFETVAPALECRFKNSLGSTESGALIASNGKVAADVDVVIDQDGVVWVRHPNQFQGYYSGARVREKSAEQHRVALEKERETQRVIEEAKEEKRRLREEEEARLKLEQELAEKKKRRRHHHHHQHHQSDHQHHHLNNSESAKETPSQQSQSATPSTTAVTPPPAPAAFASAAASLSGPAPPLELSEFNKISDYDDDTDEATGPTKPDHQDTITSSNSSEAERLTRRGFFCTGDLGEWVMEKNGERRLVLSGRANSAAKSSAGVFCRLDLIEAAAVAAKPRFVSQSFAHLHDGSSFVVLVCYTPKIAAKADLDEAAKEIQKFLTLCCSSPTTKQTADFKLQHHEVPLAVKCINKPSKEMMEEKEKGGASFSPAAAPPDLLFTVENGLLTPSMKLRRNIIAQKLKSVLDEAAATAVDSLEKIEAETLRDLASSSSSSSVADSLTKAVIASRLAASLGVDVRTIRAMQTAAMKRERQEEIASEARQQHERSTLAAQHDRYRVDLEAQHVAEMERMSVEEKQDLEAALARMKRSRRKHTMEVLRVAQEKAAAAAAATDKQQQEAQQLGTAAVALSSSHQPSPPPSLEAVLEAMSNPEDVQLAQDLRRWHPSLMGVEGAVENIVAPFLGARSRKRVPTFPSSFSSTFQDRVRKEVEEKRSQSAALMASPLGRSQQQLLKNSNKRRSSPILEAAASGGGGRSNSLNMSKMLLSLSQNSTDSKEGDAASSGATPKKAGGDVVDEADYGAYSVFLTGATGHVGGALLAMLLEAFVSQTGANIRVDDPAARHQKSKNGNQQSESHSSSSSSCAFPSIIKTDRDQIRIPTPPPPPQPVSSSAASSVTPSSTQQAPRKLTSTSNTNTQNKKKRASSQDDQQQNKNKNENKSNNMKLICYCLCRDENTQDARSRLLATVEKYTPVNLLVDVRSAFHQSVRPVLFSSAVGGMARSASDDYDDDDKGNNTCDGDDHQDPEKQRMARLLRQTLDPVLASTHYSTFDLVLHVAAEVDMIKTYAALRMSNVIFSQELANYFATRCRRYCLVSTTSVLPLHAIVARYRERDEKEELQRRMLEEEQKKQQRAAEELMMSSNSRGRRPTFNEPGNVNSFLASPAGAGVGAAAAAAATSLSSSSFFNHRNDSMSYEDDQMFQQIFQDTKQRETAKKRAEAEERAVAEIIEKEQNDARVFPKQLSAVDAKMLASELERASSGYAISKALAELTTACRFHIANAVKRAGFIGEQKGKIIKGDKKSGEAKTHMQQSVRGRQTSPTKKRGNSPSYVAPENDDAPAASSSSTSPTTTTTTTTTKTTQSASAPASVVVSPTRASGRQSRVVLLGDTLEESQRLEHIENQQPPKDVADLDIIRIPFIWCHSERGSANLSDTYHRFAASVLMSKLAFHPTAKTADDDADDDYLTEYWKFVCVDECAAAILERCFGPPPERTQPPGFEEEYAEQMNKLAQLHHRHGSNASSRQQQRSPSTATTSSRRSSPPLRKDGGPQQQQQQQQRNNATAPAPPPAPSATSFLKLRTSHTVTYREFLEHAKKMSVTDEESFLRLVDGDGGRGFGVPIAKKSDDGDVKPHSAQNPLRVVSYDAWWRATFLGDSATVRRLPVVALVDRFPRIGGPYFAQHPAGGYRRSAEVVKQNKNHDDDEEEQQGLVVEARQRRLDVLDRNLAWIMKCVYRK